MQPQENRNRRFQLSLADLMALVTLCALGLALHLWLGPTALLILPVAVFLLFRVGSDLRRDTLLGIRVLKVSSLEFWTATARDTATDPTSMPTIKGCMTIRACVRDTRSRAERDTHWRRGFRRAGRNGKPLQPSRTKMNHRSLNYLYTRAASGVNGLCRRAFGSNLNHDQLC